MKFKALILPIVVLVSGCANWAIKEKCENTNWFEHSQGVAFDGRYLDEDGLIKDCRKVDRISAVQIDQGFKLGREKMCQYSEIFDRAKEGIPIFFKFCDGLDMGRMRAQYAQGLTIYCTADKGYSFGKAGKIYKNLCNPEQSKEFLPSYYKGRKEYLVATIASYEKILIDLREKEISLSQSENRLSQEYQALPNASVCTTKPVYNEATKNTENKWICEEAPYIKSQRSGIWSALSNIRGNLSRVRSEANIAADTLKQLKDDLAQVP